MKKQNIFLLLFAITFFLQISASLAQTRLLFNDNFNDNSRYWRIGADFSGNYSIQNGNFVLEHRNPNGYKIQHRPVYVHPAKDFKITCTMSLQNGEERNGFGFVWGMKDDTFFHAIEITATGKYTVYTIDNDILKPIVKWTSSPELLGFGQENIITLQQNKGVIYLFINGKQQTSFQSPVFYGSKMGFILHGLATVHVDEMAVYQNDIGSINLAKDVKFDDSGRENLGTAINSKLDEFGCKIAPDGKTLYYVRNGDPSDMFSAGRQDIWYSKLQNDNQTWGKSQPMADLLQGQANAVISVMPDNNRLMLFRNGKLFYVQRQANGWSPLQPVVIQNDYNRGTLSSHCFGADQKTLISCTERDDSMGGMDMYVCFLQVDGTFSEPQNLGATVNTPTDDFSPFLAADGVTLYYATQGKSGYGNIDIFVTRRLDDTWKNWSEPQNLGAMVNTEDNESNFTIPASGEYAYFSSTKDAMGAKDIFRIKLPKEVQPNPVAIIYGKVRNAKDKMPLSAAMTYFNQTEEVVIGQADAEPTNGEYKIVVPLGKKYKISAQHQGFIDAHDSIDVSNLTSYKEIQLDLYLTPLVEGQSVRLNGVYFVQGEETLLATSYPELRKLVKLMQENPTMEIRLEGHTDNQGSGYLNQILSDNRVKAVKKYLVSQGIADKRIRTQGFGDKKPVADNNNVETRKLNRRVEFVITKT
jgi:outer membrane protein OmpA-like peptidoglycan-associated protein